jgi:hypothetical protein
MVFTLLSDLNASARRTKSSFQFGFTAQISADVALGISLASFGLLRESGWTPLQPRFRIVTMTLSHIGIPRRALPHHTMPYGTGPYLAAPHPTTLDLALADLATPRHTRPHPTLPRLAEPDYAGPNLT